MPGKGTGMWGLPAVELPLSLQLRRPEGPGPEGRSDGPLLWCCRADWQVGAARTTPEGHTPHDSRAVSFCLTFQRACWRPGQASRQVTGLAAALTSRPRAPASLRPHGLFPRVNGRAEGGGPSESLLLLPGCSRGPAFTRAASWAPACQGSGLTGRDASAAWLG